MFRRKKDRVGSSRKGIRFQGRFESLEERQLMCGDATVIALSETPVTAPVNEACDIVSEAEPGQDFSSPNSILNAIHVSPGTADRMATLAASRLAAQLRVSPDDIAVWSVGGVADSDAPIRPTELPEGLSHAAGKTVYDVGDAPNPPSQPAEEDSDGESDRFTRQIERLDEGIQSAIKSARKHEQQGRLSDAARSRQKAADLLLDQALPLWMRSEAERESASDFEQQAAKEKSEKAADDLRGEAEAATSRAQDDLFAAKGKADEAADELRRAAELWIKAGRPAEAAKCLEQAAQQLSPAAIKPWQQELPSTDGEHVLRASESEAAGKLHELAAQQYEAAGDKTRASRARANAVSVYDQAADNYEQGAKASEDEGRDGSDSKARAEELRKKVKGIPHELQKADPLDELPLPEPPPDVGPPREDHCGGVDGEEAGRFGGVILASMSPGDEDNKDADKPLNEPKDQGDAPGTDQPQDEPQDQGDAPGADEPQDQGDAPGADEPQPEDEGAGSSPNNRDESGDSPSDPPADNHGDGAPSDDNNAGHDCDDDWDGCDRQEEFDRLFPPALRLQAPDPDVESVIDDLTITTTVLTGIPVVIELPTTLGLSSPLELEEPDRTEWFLSLRRLVEREHPPKVLPDGLPRGTWEAYDVLYWEYSLESGGVECPRGAAQPDG